METPSELISRRLAELGMSKSDLAKAVGVSRAYIGMLANATAKSRVGFHRPKPEILAKLASALQVSESELLASMGYGVDAGADGLDLDGVEIRFGRESDLTDDEQKRLVETVRVVLSGLRAGRDKE